MYRTFAAIPLLVLVAAANASITAGHYLWDAGTLSDGTAYESFRFYVDVTSGSPSHPEDWRTAALDAELTGGTFWQDPVSANPPNPLVFSWFPDAEFDSYYTSPGDYPNTDYTGGITRLFTTDDTDTTLATEWYDMMIGPGDGEFVIAQVTVLPTDPDWTATGVLGYTGAHTSGVHWEHGFTIPEPATLSLLGLGVFAALRRR